MTHSLIKTTLTAAAILSLMPAANAQAPNAFADAWLTRADGSMVDEMSGVVCPTIIDDYDRVETASYDEGGFCAYEASASAYEFTVQFYEAGPHDTEEELVRTLGHFEDQGAIASMSSSVGCEANMASLAAGGTSIANLSQTWRDYDVNSDLRCLVLEGEDDTAWVISLQRAGDYFVSTIATMPNGSEADIAHMVDASSRFHATQFAGPSV